ncbi:reverse transcriptase [Trichonephila clavipes]|nr:reverse transcriptase [Trichonephila clavipes]
MSQKSKSIGKSWEILANVGRIPQYLERALAVASFRLTNEQVFLGVYSHCLGLPAPRFRTRMDSNHLLQCIGLGEYPTDDVVSRYREAR